MRDLRAGASTIAGKTAPGGVAPARVLKEWMTGRGRKRLEEAPERTAVSLTIFREREKCNGDSTRQRERSRVREPKRKKTVYEKGKCNGDTPRQHARRRGKKKKSKEK